MKSVIFKFSFSKVVYRDTVYNVFCKEQANTFCTETMTMDQQQIGFFEGKGFVRKFEFEDRPCLLINCRNADHINVVMDTFYPCPINTGCLSLPVMTLPDPEFRSIDR